ncbi:alpha/beta fold hydrolase [Paenibacillus sp. LMG 31456]|uniref:Alpha/beta fold hydrolase n=1 Tax=Paenibacillus foliorum TaxID=2654974 RepID=A0A972GN03_9BACL|nr:alpha/beta hydrolase [Paenibacillus foliorum]NOU93268.1 alpha/beta fold hydrolase [Paenibacillus foliorum]
MGMYRTIRGKEIFIEVIGQEGLPVILYIHGGPGVVGCTDFVQYQGSRLSTNFMLVAVDQRGVWRSEAIEDDEEITLEDIVDDFEEIRIHLGIPKWSVVSHSFGGYIAALYASMYPKSIECLVFEGPTFNFALSERSLIRAVSNELERIGEQEKSNYYLEALNEIDDYKDIHQLMNSAFRDLGDDGVIFWHGEDKKVINRIVGASVESKSLWGKSNNTRRKLLNDWRVYHSVLDDIHAISIPSLLIKGYFDPITCDEQIKEFKDTFSDSEIIIFNSSSHSVRVEEPDKYAEVVTNYIKKVRHSGFI